MVPMFAAAVEMAPCTAGMAPFTIFRTRAIGPERLSKMEMPKLSQFVFMSFD